MGETKGYLLRPPRANSTFGAPSPNRAWNVSSRVLVDSKSPAMVTFSGDGTLGLASPWSPEDLTLLQ